MATNRAQSVGRFYCRGPEEYGLGGWSDLAAANGAAEAAPGGVCHVTLDETASAAAMAAHKGAGSCCCVRLRWKSEDHGGARGLRSGLVCCLSSEWAAPHALGDRDALHHPCLSTRRRRLSREHGLLVQVLWLHTLHSPVCRGYISVAIVCCRGPAGWAQPSRLWLHPVVSSVYRVCLGERVPWVRRGSPRPCKPHTTPQIKLAPVVGPRARHSQDCKHHDRLYIPCRLMGAPSLPPGRRV